MLFHTRPLLRVYVFRQPVILLAVPTDVASRDLYGNWGRKSNLLRSTYSFTVVYSFLDQKNHLIYAYDEQYTITYLPL